MIAKSITQARKEGKVLVHKKELSRLQDIAIVIVAQNYLYFTDLKGLSDTWKINVIKYIYMFIIGLYEDKCRSSIKNYISDNSK